MRQLDRLRIRNRSRDSNQEMNNRKLVSFDLALKRLLRSKANYEVLEDFLSELLKADIEILELLESESNRDSARDKSTRVDMKVRNRKREIILIEVQYKREFDYLQRILFATAKAITEHLSTAEPYESVVKVISINILYFDLGHGEDYVYHGKTQFRGIHYHDELRLNTKQQQLFGKQYPHELYSEYYLLKINQFNDIARDPLDEWIYFLKNEEIEERFRAKGSAKGQGGPGYHESWGGRKASLRMAYRRVALPGQPVSFLLR